ncbi:MAG: response regulator [Vicinamibacterales bacterium]
MPKTVLLADDSVTIQRVVELTFAREDIRVVSVADGEQAIEALKHSVPDVVLADIDMPGRSGFEVAQFVRGQAATAEVPVLLLSGAFDPVDQERARQAGADGILTKPFDPAVLVSRVMELLSEGRGALSVVHVHPPSPSAAFRSTRALEALSVLAPVVEVVETPDAVPDVVPEVVTDAAPDAEVADVPAPAPEPMLADTADLSAPIAEPAAPAVAEPAGTDYFDQIDQAFAALSKTPRPPAPEDEYELPPLDDQPFPAVLPSVSVPRPVPREVPLTDAFTALLEAERAGQPDPALRLVPAPPAAHVSAPSVAPAIDLDALADQIARRVLAQLSDRIVRETVADITSATAERLVREEIERITRNIK